MAFYFPDKPTSFKALAETSPKLIMTTGCGGNEGERRTSWIFKVLGSCIAILIEMSDCFGLKNLSSLQLPGNNKDVPRLSHQNTFLNKAHVNYRNISSITPVHNLFFVSASPLHLNSRDVIRVRINIALV